MTKFFHVLAQFQFTTSKLKLNYSPRSEFTSRQTSCQLTKDLGN